MSLFSKLLLFCFVVLALKCDWGIPDHPMFNLNWHFYAFLKLQLAVLCFSKPSHLTSLCLQGARKPPEAVWNSNDLTYLFLSQLSVDKTSHNSLPPFLDSENKLLPSAASQLKIFTCSMLFLLHLQLSWKLNFVWKGSHWGVRLSIKCSKLTDSRG